MNAEPTEEPTDDHRSFVAVLSRPGDVREVRIPTSRRTDSGYFDDPVALAAATALWRYAERSAAHVFGRSTGDRHADALLRILRDGPLGREAAKRELGIRTAADLQDAIDLLRQIGAVETVQGRPRRRRPAGRGPPPGGGFHGFRANRAGARAGEGPRRCVRPVWFTW